jgi:pimeloyl-ACP methyl ester carboxylesterase
MRNIFVIFLLSMVLLSCQKEKITLGTGVSETFYLDNTGSSMRILVEGNTASKSFLVILAGGPGAGSYFYNTDYISQNLEDKYAVVYFDQRNSGASQGNSNGDHLTLEQMTEDLKKVIQLLKYRYGSNISVFIMGHSFGGLLASSFVTKDNYQSMLKGWIFVDGSQNYPLNDSLTRVKLMKYANQEIGLGNFVDQWNGILNYCNSIPAHNITFEQSETLAGFAFDAETYFVVVKEVDYNEIIKKYPVSQRWAITSAVFNYLYTANHMTEKLLNYEFSSQLNKVTIPTLLIFGKYDFVCPETLSDDILTKIKSTDKKLVISPFSGHYLFIQDEALFCSEIASFIRQHN